MPVVSVITALHNKGQYIADTIHSVVAQSIPGWEMLIVENASTDGGPQMVAAHAAEDSRIRLIEAPQAVRGPGAARNLGLDHATGEWILFLDADDLIENNHLEKLLSVADGHNGADVIAGGWREFNASPADASHEHIPSTLGFAHDMLLARAVAVAPWILHAAIIRKSLIGGRNRWPEHLDPYPDEDTAFWFSLLTDATVAWHRGCGALYRKLPQGSRSNSGTLLERIKGYTKIIAYNLALAEARHIRLPPRACCSISMMYEVSYRKAVETGDAAARALALQLATQWLRRCDAKNWNTRVRRLIGIRSVNSLRTILRKAAPNQS